MTYAYVAYAHDERGLSFIIWKTDGNYVCYIKLNMSPVTYLQTALHFWSSEKLHHLQKHIYIFIYIQLLTLLDMSADTVDLSILDQRPVDLDLDLPIGQATNGMLQIQVPPEIKIILKDMSRAVLKDQPKDEKGILEFLAQYLSTMLRIRSTTGQV